MKTVLRLRPRCPASPGRDSQGYRPALSTHRTPRPLLHMKAACCHPLIDRCNGYSLQEVGPAAQDDAARRWHSRRSRSQQSHIGSPCPPADLRSPPISHPSPSFASPPPPTTLSPPHHL